MKLLTTNASRWLTETVSWLYSISDPRVVDWPLMSSCLPSVIIFAGYLAFVKFGPLIMHRYQPFGLQNVMTTYNLGISLLNLYICTELYITSKNLNYSYVCQPVVFSDNPDEIRVARAIWWFYFSKIIELSDTVFLVLRKKNSQLSFLHVYHHSTMILIWYIGAKWVAGGSAFFPAMTNSFIHVLMYSYYGLAALGPNVRRYLWWKSYLTQIQMVQFAVGVYFGLQSFFVICDFPLWMKYTFVGYMLSLLILFANFYARTYRKGHLPNVLTSSQQKKQK